MYEEDAAWPIHLSIRASLCRNAADKIISFQGSRVVNGRGTVLAGIACIGIAQKLRSIHLSTDAL